MSNMNKFSDEQREEIIYWRDNIENLNLYKKIMVLHYAALGLDYAEICGLSGYSYSRISDFVREYRKNGIGYFVEEHRKGGNNRNLTPEEEKEILDKFREEAVSGRVVKLGKIKEEYERVLGREVCSSTFYAFLDRCEWRRVMPRSAHPKKATPEVINASKKLTL